jgi:hypothetical protein
MKNGVFWDIKTLFVLHRRHITSRLEVFTAVTKKNVVFWDIKASSYFTGDTLLLHYRVQPVNAM